MSCSLPPNVTILAGQSEDAPDVESLLDRTFGPGRFTRTAYRIREQAGEDPDLAFVARDGSKLVGTVAFAPIRIADAPGRLLGPLAVAPELAGKGIGLALMRAGIVAATSNSHPYLMLVGDRAYYARAGFKPVPPGRVVFPGPVDPKRLLWLPLIDDLTESPEGVLIAGRG